MKTTYFKCNIGNGNTMLFPTSVDFCLNFRADPRFTVQHLNYDTVSDEKRPITTFAFKDDEFWIWISTCTLNGDVKYVVYEGGNGDIFECEHIKQYPGLTNWESFQNCLRHLESIWNERRISRKRTMSVDFNEGDLKRCFLEY